VVARSSFSNRDPGIYSATVCMPRMHICALPVRTRDRVIYPYGEFTGAWCLPELEYAEELGAEITVRQALVWPRAEVLFKPWIDKMWDLRFNAPGGKKSAMGTFLKFYMNSLTGKFGSRPIMERYIINPKEELACRCTGPCDGACGAHKRIDDAGYIVSQKTWRIDACGHVEWSAYLTSHARVEWLKQALSKGREGINCVYGDTDSIFTDLPLERHLGDGLGEWESKGEYRDFRCKAPKCYSFERAGRPKILAKGVSLELPKQAPGEVLDSALRYATRRLFRGDKFATGAIRGFKAGAAAMKFFAKETRTRSVNVGYGDRILEPVLGITFPQEYDPVIHSGECEAVDYED
jgi:hypothetical protein